MSSKAQQNKLHKKNSLLSAALSLLTSRDMQEVSVSDITTQAGVAKGTFYSFFKDKYEIRDYLITREASRLLQSAQEELDAQDIWNFNDAVIFMISSVLRQLEENPILLRLIRRNLSLGAFHKQLRNTMNEDFFDVESRFEQKAESCGIYFEQPRLIYFMILELTGSVCYSSIVDNVPGPLSEEKPSLYDAIRSILDGAKRKSPDVIGQK